jgi:hypothetical protein
MIFSPLHRSPDQPRYYQRRQCRLLVFLAIAVSAGLPKAHAIAPDSAEAKQMIERGLKYLETQDDDRLGGKCLIGLAFYKGGRKLTHPKIVAAQRACQAAANSDMQSLDNYSVGLAVIFLLETYPETNRPLAQRYVRELLRRQQRAGGWGYEGNQRGDTSQTQYPTLALWLAINNGIDVPLGSVERICGWLLRTQDPTGAWGYHGEDPGTYMRIEQTEIRPSLVAAGLGSLYICADLLGLHETRREKEETGLPAALRPVGDPLEVKQPVSSGIDKATVRKGITDGNYWFTRHFALSSQEYTHYYFYAFERYESFRELVERRNDTHPRWYDDIATELKKTQAADGSWLSGDSAAISTSFSVLTLLRSAKKTIQVVVPKLGEGVLVGGMGLPKKTSDLQERDGKLVEEVLAGTVDELVTTIEKATPPELARLAEAPARWKLDPDVLKRSGEIAKLKALVSSGAVEARLATVKTLARIRELDNVPLLIHAMSDPDMRVVREADKGLRFISRKFEGVGLPEEPKETDAKKAAAAWKTWYQSIRPTAELLD